MSLKLITELPQLVRDLPATRALYYEDPYAKNFDAEILRKLELKDRVGVVLDRTVFYPEGGGQPGDSGSFKLPSGESVPVIDTFEVDSVIVHVVESAFNQMAASEGDSLHGDINWTRRYALMKNHTSSHLIFSALRKVLSADNLMYRGSQLGVSKSRIDVNYPNEITHEMLSKIQDLSNQLCIERRPVHSWYEERDQAEKKFGSTLGITEVTPAGRIRLVEIEGWDVGACCGTHVASTNEISLIKIRGREKISEGTERIEFSVAGAAYEYFKDLDEKSFKITNLLNTSTNGIQSRLESLVKENTALKVENELLGNLAMASVMKDLESKIEPHETADLLVHQVRDFPLKLLRQIAATLTLKDAKLVILLGCLSKEKTLIVSKSGAQVSSTIDLGKITKSIQPLIEGRGGGSQREAQIELSNAEKLGPGLEKYRSEILQTLRHGA